MFTICKRNAGASVFTKQLQNNLIFFTNAVTEDKKSYKYLTLTADAYMDGTVTDYCTAQQTFVLTKIS